VIINSFRGIDPVDANKLREQGITNTQGLLETAKDPQGRRLLSQKTNLAEDLILDWVDRANLMRIPGIGIEYSDLLEQSDICSVKELRCRDPDNLYKTMQTVNRIRCLVRRFPSRAIVHRWVKDAKELPPLVSY